MIGDVWERSNCVELKKMEILRPAQVGRLGESNKSQNIRIR